MIGMLSMKAPPRGGLPRTFVHGAGLGAHENKKRAAIVGSDDGPDTGDAMTKTSDAAADHTQAASHTATCRECGYLPVDGHHPLCSAWALTDPVVADRDRAAL
jgi:hypothetical protein